MRKPASPPKKNGAVWRKKPDGNSMKLRWPPGGVKRKSDGSGKKPNAGSVSGCGRKRRNGEKKRPGGSVKPSLPVRREEGRGAAA